MTETITPRFGLNQWSADTDTVNRPEFNNSFAKVELLSAIDKQGLLSARPAPGKVGTYYFATDKEITYRDNGVSWTIVGNKQNGLEAKPLNVSSPALSVIALPSQTGSLSTIRNSAGTLLSSFDHNGSFRSGGVHVANNVDTKDNNRLYDSSLAVVPLKINYPAQVTRGLVGQTANLHEFRTANGTIGTRVNNVGQLVTQRITKDNDTDATADNEYITRGQLKRGLPQYTLTVMSLSQYNALLVKDSKTLYVIVG